MNSNSNNNNNNKNHKDMNHKFLRLSLCDCNNGNFVVSTTRKEIEYIYDVVFKASVLTGDYVLDDDGDDVKGDSINTLGELKNYVDENYSS